MGYCQECRREVDAITVSMGTEGIERLRCPECGAFLDEGRDDFAEALREGEDTVFSDESISVPVFPSVCLVGYPDEVGRIIEEQIIQKNLARDVQVLPNGEELIVRLIQSLNEVNGEDIGLVVMEVPMPYINGINTAVAMRAIERTYANHNLIPLLFFTHKPCDDTFKKVIRFLNPAKYAHLGPSDERSQVVPVINKVISLLAQEKWG